MKGNNQQNDDLYNFDLQNIIEKYGHRPELLELVLSCKVQEDKRKTEEAKLKQKEIEYHIMVNQKEEEEVSKNINRIHIHESEEEEDSAIYKGKAKQASDDKSDDYFSFKPLFPSSSTSTHSDQLLFSSISLPSLKLPDIKHSDMFHNRRHSESFFYQPKEDESNILPPISFKKEQEKSPDKKKRKSTSKLDTHSTLTDSTPKKLILPINRPVRLETPRRRRKEMQAISMIIETKEFPYNDDYVWKNNGNTIHKSSGQKSIYYKCANSNNGCTVNKTVTFKENGEYLIKYRGNHLDDCNKIKRIINTSPTPTNT